MFNKRLKAALALAKAQIATLETQLHYERVAYKELGEALRFSAQSSPVLIDFELLSVVSINRTMGARGPYTIVHYVVWSDTGREIRENSYTCSEETHYALLKEFKRYLETK